MDSLVEYNGTTGSYPRDGSDRVKFLLGRCGPFHRNGNNFRLTEFFIPSFKTKMKGRKWVIVRSRDLINHSVSEDRWIGKGKEKEEGYTDFICF